MGIKKVSGLSYTGTILQQESCILVDDGTVHRKD